MSDAPDELKIALDNRAFEIQLFWQRSNYFLVLMSALGIGTFTAKDTLFAPVICLFAAISSYLWFRVNLGSKFWQESWEVEVAALAKERKIRSFERPMSEVKAQVAKSLRDGWADEKHSWLQKWVDSETTKKFSVTYHMILLSLSSCLIWSLVCIFLLIRLDSTITTAKSERPTVVLPVGARIVVLPAASVPSQVISAP